MATSLFPSNPSFEPRTRAWVSIVPASGLDRHRQVTPAKCLFNISQS